MRVMSAIGLYVLMLAAAISIGGCARNAPKQMDISVAGQQHLSSTDKSMSALLQERAALDDIRQRVRSEAVDTDNFREYVSASGQIAERISAGIEEWERLADQAAAAPKSPVLDQVNKAPNLVKFTPLPAEEIEIRRRYAQQSLNLHIRAQLLESRLASAGESERQNLASKLEQAKAAIQQLDDRCLTEISGLGASAGPAKVDAVDSTPVEPLQAKLSADGKIVADATHLCSMFELGMINQVRLPPIDLGGSSEFGRQLSDTCRSVDRAVALFKHGLEEGKSR
jgi:hypothetical protein